jgi:hypothetical protein
MAVTAKMQVKHREYLKHKLKIKNCQHKTSLRKRTQSAKPEEVVASNSYLTFKTKKTMGLNEIKERYNQLKFLRGMIDNGSIVHLNKKDRKIVTKY